MINIVIYCCNTAFNIIPAFEVEIFGHFQGLGGSQSPSMGQNLHPTASQKEKKVLMVILWVHICL